jgi:hypothetical protein
VPADYPVYLIFTWFAWLIFYVTDDQRKPNLRDNSSKENRRA